MFSSDFAIHFFYPLFFGNHHAEEVKSWPRGYKPFFIFSSAEHKIVGILTFISRINTTSERPKARIFFIRIF